ESIEIERIAGGDDETHHGIPYPHAGEFAHDLRQHRIRGRGRQDDGQLFAEVVQKLENVQPGDDAQHAAEHDEHEQDDARVENENQRNQLLERANAVFTDRVGD